MSTTSLIDLAKRARALRAEQEASQAEDVLSWIKGMQIGEILRFCPLQHETLEEAHRRLKPLVRDAAKRHRVRVVERLDGTTYRVRRVGDDQRGKFAELEELGLGQSTRLFERAPRDFALKEADRMAAYVREKTGMAFDIFERPDEFAGGGVWATCIRRGDRYCV